MTWSPRLAAAALLLLVAPASALDGQPGMHDPSTVIRPTASSTSMPPATACRHSISDDGWTWRRGGSRDAGGARRQARARTSSPAAATTRGRRTSSASATSYFLYYSAPGTQPKSAIGLLVGKTLDPDVAGLQVGGRRAGRLVRRRRGQQRDRSRRVSRSRPTARCGSPTVRTSATSVWSSWIRRPASGCIPIAQPVNVAINSEASIMIFRDGWYYLLVTHGSCCAGGELQLQHPHGPREEGDRPVPRQHGRSTCCRAAASCSSAPSGRYVGPGHFGLLDLGDGVQKFSLPLRSRPRSRRRQRARHPSAALARRLAGRRRERHGRHLRDRVGADGHGARAGRPGRAGRRAARPRRPRRPGPGGPPGRGGRGARAPRAARHPRRRLRAPIPPQEAVAGVGELAGRAGRRADGAVHAPGAAEVGDRAGRRMPAATPGRRTSRSRSPARIARSRRRRMRELVVLPAFTGAPEQLWRIDQLADGTYRLMPKAVPECEGPAGAVRRRQQHADARDIQPRRAIVSAGTSGRHDGSRMNTSCRGSRCRSLADRRALRAVGVGVLAAAAADRRRPRRRRGAAAGAVAGAAGVAGQAGRRRRLHPAMAAPRADSRCRVSSRKPRCRTAVEKDFPDAG